MRKDEVIRGKIGCPTWIRTMTKASKEPCATITPSDNARGNYLRTAGVQRKSCSCHLRPRQHEGTYPQGGLMKYMMFILAALLLVGCRSNDSRYNTGSAPSDSYNTPST